MALTSDEEAFVRRLMAALPVAPPMTRSGGVKDGPVRVALANLEGYLRDLVTRLK